MRRCSWIISNCGLRLQTSWLESSTVGCGRAAKHSWKISERLAGQLDNLTALAVGGGRCAGMARLYALGSRPLLILIHDLIHELVLSDASDASSSAAHARESTGRLRRRRVRPNYRSERLKGDRACGSPDRRQQNGWAASTNPRSCSQRRGLAWLDHVQLGGGSVLRVDHPCLKHEPRAGSGRWMCCSRAFTFRLGGNAD